MLGAEWTVVAPGRVSLSVQSPADWMLNPFGIAHGGILATLLDTVLGCAVQTTLVSDMGSTSDLHVRYLRPVTAETGRLLATGEVVQSGRRLATAQGRVEAEATGKLIATATGGFPISQAPPPT